MESGKKKKMTKKMAKEFLKKVFGSCPSDLYQDEMASDINGGLWCVNYGTMTAECRMTDSGQIQLGMTLGIYPVSYIYYDPQTYEIDHEYMDEKQRETDRETAFEYMEAHNFVVKKKPEIVIY